MFCVVYNNSQKQYRWQITEEWLSKQWYNGIKYMWVDLYIIVNNDLGEIYPLLQKDNSENRPYCTYVIHSIFVKKILNVIGCALEEKGLEKYWRKY